MTEKWAQQSHKAFPPCLAQRVQYADDRFQFCIIAALDQPDVSGCTRMTEKYLSKVAENATFKIHGKRKKPDTKIRGYFQKDRRIPGSKCPAIWCHMAEAIDPLHGTPVKLTPESRLSDRLTFHVCKGIIGMCMERNSPVSGTGIVPCGSTLPAKRQVYAIGTPAIGAFDLQISGCQAHFIKPPLVTMGAAFRHPDRRLSHTASSSSIRISRSDLDKYLMLTPLSIV